MMLLTNTYQYRRRLFAAVTAVACSFNTAQALTIEFDYSYDTAGFFGKNQRAALDAAGQFYEESINQSFRGISASGTNEWTANFLDPSTGKSTTIENMKVADDSVVIFAGAMNMSQLGYGGYGGFNASGTTSFLDDVITRGIEGTINGTNTPGDDTAFATWGGQIMFDTDANWHYGLSTTDLEFDEFDFYSVALHELGHVFGLGTADSWAAQIDSNGFFTGKNVIAEFGKTIMIDEDGDHFADDTKSLSIETGKLQDSIMSAAIRSGERRVFTALDVAALKDTTTWDINVDAVPEPSSAVLSLAGLALLANRRTRRV